MCRYITHTTFSNQHEPKLSFDLHVEIRVNVKKKKEKKNINRVDMKSSERIYMSVGNARVSPHKRNFSVS